MQRQQAVKGAHISYSLIFLSSFAVLSFLSKNICYCLCLCGETLSDHLSLQTESIFTNTKFLSVNFLKILPTKKIYYFSLWRAEALWGRNCTAYYLWYHGLPGVLYTNTISHHNITYSVLTTPCHDESLVQRSVVTMLFGWLELISREEKEKASIQL